MKSCKAAAVMIDPRLATSFLPQALAAVEEDQSYRIPVTSRALETPIQAHPRHGLSGARRRLHGRSRDSGARGVKEPLAKEERDRLKLAGSGHQSRTCLSYLIVASLALGAGQTILF